MCPFSKTHISSFNSLLYGTGNLSVASLFISQTFSLEGPHFFFYVFNYLLFFQYSVFQNNFSFKKYFQYELSLKLDCCLYNIMKKFEKTATCTYSPFMLLLKLLEWTGCPFIMHNHV